MVARFLIFVFSCSIALAGPWEDFVQAHKTVESARNRWTLCVKPGLVAPGELLADAEYQKLATGGDWGVEVLGAGPAQGLQASLGAQWALLAPSGEVAGAGKGRPRGPAILDAIHASGAQSRWETRVTFLKDHPGQAEARSEALAQELRLLRSRLASLDSMGKVKVPAWHPEPGVGGDQDRVTLAGADGDTQAGDLYATVGEALRELARAAAWYQDAHWLASRLAQFDLGQSAALRPLFRDLAAEVEAKAQGDPEDVALTQLWMELLDGARLLTGGVPGGAEPVPGAVWPSVQALEALLEPYRRRRDLEGEQRLLDSLTPQGPPAPLTIRGWEAYCELQGALLAHQSAAFAGSGSWEQARAALDASSDWGGARVAQMALLRRGSIAGGDAWRRLIVQAASRPSRRPHPPAIPPPLHLTLLGRPAWLLAWTGLREAPELAAWSPGELRWEIASADTFARLRTRFGWGHQARWAIFQGEELKATGEACPDPRGLAGVLAGQGSPYLERLAQAIARNPGHTAARRARFQALQARMPDPRLEPLMAEDAAQALLPLPFGPGDAWKPDAALWGAAAETALPQLEARLRSWPTDAELWRAWLSWSRFHPGHPSALDLARGLPFWFPDGDWRTALPYGVQRAVAAELRRQGNFLQMRDWFQASWEVLDHRPVKDLRPWERAWFHERRVQEETAVVQPLREALRALGLHEQQLELEKVFGAMMGRDVSRSR